MGKLNGKGTGVTNKATITQLIKSKKEKQSIIMKLDAEKKSMQNKIKSLEEKVINLKENVKSVEALVSEHQNDKEILSNEQKILKEKYERTLATLKHLQKELDHMQQRNNRVVANLTDS